MESIEKVHAISASFDIIWPAGRLNEGPGPVITKLVDGRDKSSKVDGRVGI
jgi:hypothetical protein